MAIDIKHPFVSAKTDSPDSTRVQPSNWNAGHTLTLGAAKVLGRDTSAAGPAQELPLAFDATLQSMVPPTGTTAQRPAAPVAGMMRYNSTIPQMEVYVGGAWIGLGALGAALTSISGLTTTTDKMIYTTAANVYATADLSPFARTLLDDLTQLAVRATLALTPGTDVQAFDTDLAAIAALATTGIISRTGAGTVATRTITSTDGTVTITNPGGVAGNINLAVAGGVTLLGTLTLSGGSQTMSGLALTNYKFLRVVVVGASVSSFSDTLSIAGAGVFPGLGASTCRGFMEIDLTDGTFHSSLALAGVTASVASATYAGDTATTTASTSLVVSLATQNFGGGTVRIYGVP